MLVLEGKGAAADAEAFRAAGIGDFEVFDFERGAKRPDGTPVKVAFSLAFAADSKAPDMTFFTCQQHYPENFWNPAFQSHANTVSGVAGVVFVADNPTDHHIFLKAFSGAQDLHSSSLGVKARTGNGDIEIMEQVAFRDQFGISPDVDGEGMTLNALRFEVADMAQAEASHRQNGVASRRHMARLVVPPDVAHGATLIFETAKWG
jgi:hypothetical protein